MPCDCRSGSTSWRNWLSISCCTQSPPTCVISPRVCGSCSGSSETATSACLRCAFLLQAQALNPEPYRNLLQLARSSECDTQVNVKTYCLIVCLFFSAGMLPQNRCMGQCSRGGEQPRNAGHRTVARFHAQRLPCASTFPPTPHSHHMEMCLQNAAVRGDLAQVGRWL